MLRAALQQTSGLRQLLAQRAFTRTGTKLQESGREGGKPAGDQDLRSWHTFVLKSGTVVAWHPKRHFPYEHSRPVDLGLAQAKKEHFYASLREAPQQSRIQHRRIAPPPIALREIFYTDRQEWTEGGEALRSGRAAGEEEQVSLKPGGGGGEGVSHSTRSSIRALWFPQRIPYLDGLRIQEHLFEKIKSDRAASCHYLCLFEHYPAYTVGIRSQLYPPEEEQRLRSLGAEFHRVRRGGLITFHGPGQLVGYPIFDLASLNVGSPEGDVKRSSAEDGGGGKSSPGVNLFVKLVEEALIRCVVRHFGVWGAGRTENPGVWVDGYRKIAAVGMQVRSGITSHGFALNCNTDLAWFRNIVPCGIEGKLVTSIIKEIKKDEGMGAERDVDVKEAIEPICTSFQSVFNTPVELRRLEVQEELGGVDAMLESDAFKTAVACA